MSDLGNLDNIDDERNDSVVVTNYQDFRKIMCAYIKYAYPKSTDTDVEELIKKGGGEGIAQAIYAKNKKNFAEGRYVYSKTAAAAMNYE